MLDENQKKKIADKTVKLMLAFEQELIKAISEELAGLESLDLDSVNNHQLAIALKVQELKKKYSKKFHEERLKAFASAFTLSAKEELKDGDIN